MTFPLYFWLSNATTLVIGLCGTWYLRKQGAKTKSDQLTSYIPTLWTSLGILFTFISIFCSLWDYTAKVKELDILEIVQDIIPAFSTSIIGISGAMISTFITKLSIAHQEASETLKFIQLKNQVIGQNASSDSPEMILLEILNAVNLSREAATKQTDSILLMLHTLSESGDILCTNIKNTMIEAMITQQKSFDITLEKLTSTFTNNLYLLSEESNQRNLQLQEFMNTSSSNITEIYTDIEAKIAAHLENEKKLFLTDIKATIEEFAAKQNESCTQEIAATNATFIANAQYCLAKQTESHNKFLGSLNDYLSGLSDNLISSISNYSKEVCTELKTLQQQQSAELQSSIKQNSEGLGLVIEHNRKLFKEIADFIKDDNQTLKNDLFDLQKKIKEDSVEIARRFTDNLVQVCQEAEYKLDSILKSILQIGLQIGNGADDIRLRLHDICSAFVDKIDELKKSIVDNTSDLIKELTKTIVESIDVDNLASTTVETTKAISASMNTLRSDIDVIVKKFDQISDAVRLSAGKFERAAEKSDTINTYIDGTTELFKVHILSIAELRSSLSAIEDTIKKLSRQLVDLTGQTNIHVK